MFSKILIANRGEIACRIVRTARALGYGTVAVFSDADEGAPHVAVADEAVRVGPAPAAQSYLHVERLIDAARRSGADAVHPGYGFLSERADFAQACADAGLVFIGPPPAAIAAMGDKAGAKRRLIAAGVPCASGHLGEDQRDEALIAAAHALGLPLLVKAVAGGGGRGMRLVRAMDELPGALDAARREAQGAFGDGRLMLERLIERGRHIEIQVVCDAHGRGIHLGERDCSAQRRRQKVIEEAPSPVIDAQKRALMGADAVAAALAVGYVGAGTVEFIVDAQMNHWFLEMNTRLQVEHPVTECITGIDLVEWQLRIAAGEPLPLAQDEVRLSGHAIEVRLYAEDPVQGFAPQTGTVRHWRPEAALRAGLRIDAGMAEGSVVTPFYDPLLAKLIAHGRDRGDAIRRLRAALADAPLLGLAHNGAFLRALLERAEFREARLHTTQLDEWLAAGDALYAAPTVPEAVWLLAAALLGWTPEPVSRPASLAMADLTLELAGERRTLRAGPGGAAAASGGEPLVVRSWHDHVVRFEHAGVQRRAVAVRAGDVLHLELHGQSYALREVSPWPRADDGARPGRVRAPVAGTVAALRVTVGDTVQAGAPLVCVEAMKMQMWLQARSAGRIRAVHVAPGHHVQADALLLDIEIDEGGG
jgi:geranyl-CoA carboxylase alpha subunit